jgi:hypothetical protein
MKNNMKMEGQITLFDEEDDYVEVTGVDDVEDGWEEVMVVDSPPTRKADHTIHITNTITTQINILPQPTQPITINNVDNNTSSLKIPEVLVALVSSTPSEPNQDPAWLASLKANGKVPYSAQALGDPQYTAPLGMFVSTSLLPPFLQNIY